ncbi:MAG: PHP domain-containing protein [Deltaproteobacteria bacterium]|nr:PHP domain-containing protein [Deltaproteobacteria bacterium]
MFQIDLHSHSTFSDGTLSPAQLVAAAAAAGLKGLALTDHDTVEGVPEFFSAGKKRNFRTVGGVELSLNFKGTTHMLGYRLGGDFLPDLDLSFLQEYRRERNRAMFQKLLDLGFPLSWERVEEIAGDGLMGKPHLALALREKGIVSATQEAFELYLGKGRPAYVEKRRLGAEEGVKLLLNSGYAPVLAHPGSLKLAPGEYGEKLAYLKSRGLVGVEIYHPENGPELRRELSRAAEKLDLVATNGSDYHGANKKTPLSWVRENSPLSFGVLEELRKGLEKVRRSFGGN